MSGRLTGARDAREALRRLIPLGARARVMRVARRMLLDAGAPPGSVLGGFDAPAEGAVAPDRVLHIIGWAIRDGRMPTMVEVRLDGVPLGRARLGLGRRDLLHLGPEATACGFELTVPPPPELDGRPRRLFALARFDGGARHVIAGPSITAAMRRSARPASPRRSGATAAAAGEPGRAHVLAATHQLDLGGGQLYLQDLLRGLSRSGRFRLSVATMVDGPLRDELEDLGIGVHVLGPWPHQDAAHFSSRLDELAAWMRSRNVDAVLANTIINFPVVHAAAAVGIPSVWAIHESYPLPILSHVLMGDTADPAVRRAAWDALTTADRLVFEAAATRALYAPAAGEERCLHIPYGVELAALDRSVAGLDRAGARRRLGIPARARLLVCVGNFEMRKSQTVLVRAFSDVADRHPAAQLALVGDNGSEYGRHVRHLAEATGLGSRLRILPVTPDVLTWYLAADVLVSASDVESMPRSAIEAMALGTPVLGVDVYGVPELITDGDTGWLVAQSDAQALADGMERVLSLPDAGLAAIGRRAREHARRHHDAGGYVAAVGDLLEELAVARQQPNATPAEPVPMGR